jgi:hypothetical protein
MVPGQNDFPRDGGKQPHRSGEGLSTSVFYIDSKREKSLDGQSPTSCRNQPIFTVNTSRFLFDPHSLKGVDLSIVLFLRKNILSCTKEGTCFVDFLVNHDPHT